MFHRVFCLFYTMFHQIILKSSQVLWFIKYVSYISVLYSVPNATLYHSRGRGSLTSFWCGCSFYVGNVSSLFRYMSHCLHYQKLFKIFFISSFISKAYQKNCKNWKNVVANTSTKPRLSQGTQPVFLPLLQASVFYRDNNTKKELHCSLNIRCRCMSFICSVISTCAPVSVAWPRSLQKTLSHERPRICAHIQGVVIRVVARLLSSKDHILFQVIRSFSMFHRDFCWLRHVSSDHSQIKSSFMIHQICFIHFRVILCS